MSTSESAAGEGRLRPADPDFPGIPARRRERRESRECDGGRAVRSREIRA
jgi:hypothetical protein